MQRRSRIQQLNNSDEKGFFEALLEDGRPALLVTAVALFVSGAFAIFLSVRREFLPHDIAYLGVTAEDLCQMARCNVVSFMFHDRMAFGGSLIAVAILYLWLLAVPLRAGERWAWWTFTASGLVGFGSFLTYLGHGYFDTWHGVATLALLPVFIAGLVRSYGLATVARIGWIRTQDGRIASRLVRCGRVGLLVTGGGMTLAGAVIMFLGSTDVFVVEDLEFMGVSREQLDQINSRLVPVIAHDRAGLGGGLATAGLIVAISCWFAPPARAFHQAIVLAGIAGFGFAVGTHFYEGYTNPVHLAPAFAGVVLFLLSISAEIIGTTLRTPR